MEAWGAATPDRGVDCSFCRSVVFHSASQSVSSQTGIPVFLWYLPPMLRYKQQNYVISMFVNGELNKRCLFFVTIN